MHSFTSVTVPPNMVLLCTILSLPSQTGHRRLCTRLGIVMIELGSQKDLRAAQRLPFCCICGRAFTAGEKRTRQHVPPKAIFATADRTPPLILPAHAKCNTDQSSLDTVIGQLVAVLHGKYPAERDVRLEIDVFHSELGRTSAGVNGGSVKFHDFNNPEFLTRLTSWAAPHVMFALASLVSRDVEDNCHDPQG